MISPVADAYGPEADRSNLADYLEILALAGQALAVEDLADYLQDRDWNVRSRELFQLEWHDEGDDDGTRDDADGGAGAAPQDVLAADVYEYVARRESLLGDDYPFFQDSAGLHVKVDLTDSHRSYLLLLAVTIAHHYCPGDDSLDPEGMFEEIVAQAMLSRGLKTANTGKLGGATHGPLTFPKLVEDVGDALSLIGSPSSAPFRTFANEEGVDTVSHLAWGDTRAGHWLFVGQATCSRSNEWNRKITEPKVAQWTALLSSVVPALAYLAVPHDVEEEHLTYLSKNHRRLVLDRSRLCRFLGPLTVEQEALLDAVRKKEVFNPKGA